MAAAAAAIRAGFVDQPFCYQFGFDPANLAAFHAEHGGDLGHRGPEGADTSGSKVAIRCQADGMAQIADCAFAEAKPPARGFDQPQQLPARQITGQARMCEVMSHACTSDFLYALSFAIDRDALSEVLFTGKWSAFSFALTPVSVAAEPAVFLSSPCESRQALYGIRTGVPGQFREIMRKIPQETARFRHRFGTSICFKIEKW